MVSFGLVWAAAVAALAGCSNWTLGGVTSPALPAQTDAIERSKMRLAKLPHVAGECIIANARTEGAAAELIPLYGLDAVAVTVSSRVAGDKIAIFSLTRDDGGAQADTTTWAGLPDRPELLRKLTQGC